MGMEAILGIPLYSYLYFKLAKMLPFLLSLMFSLQQNWKRGKNRFFLEARLWVEKGKGGVMAQTIYTHMNKCISN
jgi:hypothetical protein